jgi:signal transduction histidine kinase/CheY-like chemotaxis protein/HPt (histidine-containing phosphotransfer) domain-containing protein
VRSLKDTRYYRLGNSLAVSGIAVYGLLRVFTLSNEGHYWTALVSFAFYASTSIALWFLHRVKAFNAAFSVPLTMFLLYSTASVFTGSFTHYFGACFVICGVGAVYGNHKMLLYYLLVSNCIILVLLLFKLPLNDLERNIPMTEALFNWLLLLFGSLFYYLVTRFASQKNTASIRAMDSFTTLMDTTTDWLVMVDALNRISYLSKPLARFARIDDPAMAAGRPLFDLFGDPAVKLMIGEILEKRAPLSDIIQIPVYEEPRSFAVIADHLSGETPGFFIHLSDITELVNARDDAELARRAAEAANRAKSEFLASMSHEIRTPMNAIIGMSDLMRTDNLDQVQQGYFEDIRKMSKTLLSIINDILDFSKIEAGKLELVQTHFNITMLFDNIVSMFQFIAADKNLALQSECAPDIPKILYGDEIRIRQILTNIVNNAIKYTRKGYVRFALSQGRRNGADYLIATVEDSGIGIKSEDMPRLFGTFQQFDMKKNRGITGTGLGLAITKRLLDMMGGFVELKSEYGKGSTFTIFIPLVPGLAAKTETNTGATQTVYAATDDLHILVVDDTPENLTVAAGFLATHNIQADTADGGEAAIRLVQTKRYDLVFMDHMMPDVDGIEAAIRIRALADTLPFASDWYRKMPIIALSANAVQGARALFLASTMNDFVSKPIEARALNEALIRWLPAEKLTFDRNAAPLKPVLEETDALSEELSAIPHLDVSAGFSHTGGRNSYYKVLRQFCNGFDENTARVTAALESADWSDYAIRIHAFKGVLATIGHQELAEAAFKLEQAAKSATAYAAASDAEICRRDTGTFRAALALFRKELLATSLIPKTGVKR